MSRPAHPGAWWLWALGLATVASRTVNPLLLCLLAVVAGCVAVRCREAVPWASAYGTFVRFGLLVIGIRVVFNVLLGSIGGSIVLFSLPRIPLPDWAHGIRLGGPVTAEGLVFAVDNGLQLAVLLACVGAANSLANPNRLLRGLPAALYEVSVAVVVAMTVAPQLVASAKSVRRARELRGDTARGVRAIRTLLIPVLTDALDRALLLAAAMDSRGYGRGAGLSRPARRCTAALVLAGLVGISIGAFGLLGADTPTLLGVPMLIAGVVLAIAGLVVGSRRVGRSRYRPNRWGRRELLIAGSGLFAAAATLVAAAVNWPMLGGAALTPSTVPLIAPQLPLLPVLGVLVALLPVLTEAREDAR